MRQNTTGCEEGNQTVAGRRDRASARSRSPWLAGALAEHLPAPAAFSSAPPSAVAVLAYRLQTDELGDIDPVTARLLKQIATGGGTVKASRVTEQFGRRRTELKPGMILMREWNAQAYRVMVVDKGFAWSGKTYDSLSKVAFAITGTNWNGPRFFGLRDQVKS